MKELKEQYRRMLARIDLLSSTTRTNAFVLEHKGYDSVRVEHELSNGIFYTVHLDHLNLVRVGNTQVSFELEERLIKDEHMPILKNILLNLRKFSTSLDFWEKIPTQDQITISGWKFIDNERHKHAKFFIPDKILLADGTKITEDLRLYTRDDAYWVYSESKKQSKEIIHLAEIHRRLIPCGSIVLHRNQCMKVCSRVTQDFGRHFFRTFYNLKTPAGEILKGVAAIDGVIHWETTSFSKKRIVI